MLFEKKFYCEHEMQVWVKQVSHTLKPPLFIALNGELGAGKTTFVRSVLRAFGYKGIVRSPTFTLVECYEFPTFQVFHLDLYRLREPEEVVFLGIEEIFKKNNLCLIEWPEKGKGFLPLADLMCTILIQGETQRHVKLESLSTQGDLVLTRFQGKI